MKTKGVALCLCYHGVSHCAFGTCCCNMKKNHKVYSFCNKLTKKATHPTNSRCWNPTVRMWEIARPRSRFIHRRALFLAFDQKYLRSPSPVVETNENFYICRKFLMLPEMPQSCFWFPSVFCYRKRSQQTNCNKKKTFKVKESTLKLKDFLNAAGLISNSFQGTSRPIQSNLSRMCVQLTSCVR